MHYFLVGVDLYYLINGISFFVYLSQRFVLWQWVLGFKRLIITKDRSDRDKNFEINE